jgi:hypothetical protein
MLKKLQQIVSLTGIRNDVLPGIKIAFFLVYALFVQFRQELLAIFGIGQIKPVAAYIILAIGASVGSVVLWAISGYILDPLYNLLYGPAGRWTRKSGRPWGIFYSGYDLDQFRQLARKKLSEAQPVYKKPDMSIYRPTLDRLRSGNPKLYEEVESELENSKAFRNAILPTIFLLVWFAYSKAVGPALVSLVALIALIELSFRGRAQHTLKAYRWLTEDSGTARAG